MDSSNLAFGDSIKCKAAAVYHSYEDGRSRSTKRAGTGLAAAVVAGVAVPGAVAVAENQSAAGIPESNSTFRPTGQSRPALVGLKLGPPDGLPSEAHGDVSPKLFSEPETTCSASSTMPRLIVCAWLAWLE
jgi:hypothetical protein